MIKNIEVAKQRLLLRINKNPNGCWEFKGAIRAGYGVMKIDGKLQSTHRIAYRVFKGEIPESLMVCHTCDNKMCVNPDHLFPGTAYDNVVDAVNKGRIIPPTDLGIRFEKGHIPTNKVISDDVVIEIKKLLGDNLKPSKIAKQFNLSRHFVNDVKRGKTYSHL